jgi:hypothetical protein
MARLSAKMRKHTKNVKKHNFPLDTMLEKPGRGRPARVRPLEIRGRADNYRGILDHVWDRLWLLLSRAQTKADVINALQEAANPYDREFIPLAELVLGVLQEQKFPKKREAQIKFMADSLAGLGGISLRRSRDICERQRAMEKQAQKIIRYEYYIECSCGYKGRSRDHGCPECGAKIVFDWTPIL